MALSAYPLTYISDEVSSISVAANFGGGSWNDVVANAGYYGIGFLWIFGGLFSLNLSSIAIYRVMHISLAIVNSFIGPISYVIITKFFEIKARAKNIIVSCLCGTSILLYAGNINVRNEEVLACLSCITFYLLCLIIEKRKFKDELLLVFVLLYSLTCHTRAISLVLVVVAVGVLYTIYYRKKIFHIRTYLILGIGVIVVNYLLKLYRAVIWNNSSVRNSSVSKGIISSIKKAIEADDFWGVVKTWIKIVIGQVYSATSLTGGLFLIATIICTVYFFLFFKEKKDIISEKKIVISVAALTLVYMTIATMGLTWFWGVYSNMQELGLHKYSSTYRAFTYTRYFGIYVPMLILAGYVIAEADYRLIKMCVKTGIIVYLAISFIWINEIIVYIDTGKNTNYFLLAGFRSEYSAEMTSWLRAALLGMDIVVLCFLFLSQKRDILALSSVLILLVSEQLYAFQYSVKPAQEMNFIKADAGYNLINKMAGILEKDIYVCDLSKKTDHQIYYIYQFLNYKYHIIPSMPESIEEDFIMFSNKMIEKIQDEKIFYQKLDENEYVYTNVDKYKEAISYYCEEQYE